MKSMKCGFAACALAFFSLTASGADQDVPQAFFQPLDPPKVPDELVAQLKRDGLPTPDVVAAALKDCVGIGIDCVNEKMKALGFRVPELDPAVKAQQEKALAETQAQIQRANATGAPAPSLAIPAASSAL